MKKLIGILVVIFLMTSTTIWARQILPKTGRVTQVVDGDTVVIDGKWKVRYLGVDTPEIGHPSYKAATLFNRKLVYGKQVTLTACKPRPIGGKGRYLAYLRVGDIDVSRELLKAGLAEVFDDTWCDENRGDAHWRLMIDAHKAGRGMWAHEIRTQVADSKAYEHVEQVRIVTGVVKKVVNIKGAIFLNFSGNWRTKGFSVHIYPKDLKRFKKFNPQELAGKKVQIIGRIIRKTQGPYIVCHSPYQFLKIGKNPVKSKG